MCKSSINSCRGASWSRYIRCSAGYGWQPNTNEKASRNIVSGFCEGHDWCTFPTLQFSLCIHRNCLFLLICLVFWLLWSTVLLLFSPAFVYVFWALYAQGDLHSTTEYQSLLGSLENLCVVDLFYFDHSVSVVFTHPWNINSSSLVDSYFG